LTALHQAVTYLVAGWSPNIYRAAHIKGSGESCFIPEIAAAAQKAQAPAPYKFKLLLAKLKLKGVERLR